MNKSAVLGLGAMGRRMAANLIKAGYARHAAHSGVSLLDTSDDRPLYDE